MTRISAWIIWQSSRSVHRDQSLSHSCQNFDFWYTQTSSSMAFTAGHVDFICYNEDNTTFPEATVMGWGATQVYNHAQRKQTAESVWNPTQRWDCFLYSFLYRKEDCLRLIYWKPALLYRPSALSTVAKSINPTTWSAQVVILPVLVTTTKDRR